VDGVERGSLPGGTHGKIDAHIEVFTGVECCIELFFAVVPANKF
jgi:hypothetical protein